MEGLSLSWDKADVLDCHVDSGTEVYCQETYDNSLMDSDIQGVLYIGFISKLTIELTSFVFR